MMVNCAFGMRGQLSLALCGTKVDYEYADGSARALPEAAPHGRGRMCQKKLYAGRTSMVPLFWRTTTSSIRWSTNPTDLLDGEPKLSDVALDLLPMIIAERGFPHDRSWFAPVQRLPAGACLTLQAGGLPPGDRLHGFLPSAEQPRSAREAAHGPPERPRRGRP